MSTVTIVPQLELLTAERLDYTALTRDTMDFILKVCEPWLRAVVLSTFRKAGDWVAAGDNLVLLKLRDGQTGLLVAPMTGRIKFMPERSKVYSPICLEEESVAVMRSGIMAPFTFSYPITIIKVPEEKTILEQGEDMFLIQGNDGTLGWLPAPHSGFVEHVFVYEGEGLERSRVIVSFPGQGHLTDENLVPVRTDYFPPESASYPITVIKVAQARSAIKKGEEIFRLQDNNKKIFKEAPGSGYVENVYVDEGTVLERYCCLVSLRKSVEKTDVMVDVKLISEPQPDTPQQDTSPSPPKRGEPSSPGNSDFTRYRARRRAALEF